MKTSGCDLYFTEQDISAPPFQRSPFRHWDFSALGHLGTGRFGADRFGARHVCDGDGHQCRPTHWPAVRDGGGVDVIKARNMSLHFFNPCSPLAVLSAARASAAAE